ncbi:MAG: DUF2378 family protein [Myxococcaceae bacterium]
MRKTTLGKLSPRCVARLRELGFDFDKPLLSAYPLQNWETATEVVVADLFPDRPIADARTAFGRLFMEGFAQTAIGIAVVMVGRAIGVRRTLARMTRNMRNGNNYTSTELVELGKGHVELKTSMLPEFLPLWRGKPNYLAEQFVGVLQVALELLHAKDGTVTMKGYDLEHRVATYVVKWKE